MKKLLLLLCFSLPAYAYDESQYDEGYDDAMTGSGDWGDTNEEYYDGYEDAQNIKRASESREQERNSQRQRRDNSNWNKYLYDDYYN